VYKHNQELKGDDLVALEQVVDYCNSPDVPCEALILGGDQVDSPRIGDDHVIKLRQILRKCQAPVYYIDGNHERGFRRLELEGGEAGVATNLEGESFLFGDFDVTGYNWRPRREWEEWMSTNGNERYSDILILHGFADQAVAELGLSEAAVDLGDYDLNWFDGKCKLCLMGDIHQTMHFVGAEHSTHFHYPGSMWMHRSNEPADKVFFRIDSDLTVTNVPLQTRPFFKANIYNGKDMASLLSEVLKADTPGYAGIQKPRVHVDIYAEDNFDKELEILKQNAHLFVRLKPSRTVMEVERLSLESGIVDTKEIVKNVVSDEDKDLRSFLNEVLESGAEHASEQLRKKLGVG
jgi:DNA repair exonuclease SbcCD nuclease subunit